MEEAEGARENLYVGRLRGYFISFSVISYLYMFLVGPSFLIAEATRSSTVLIIVIMCWVVPILYFIESVLIAKMRKIVWLNAFVLAAAPLMVSIQLAPRVKSLELFFMLWVPMLNPFLYLIVWSILVYSCLFKPDIWDYYMS